MTSHTTTGFRGMFARLPGDVQQHARDAYRAFLRDPFHPSLRFKRLNSGDELWSVRVGLHYRAVGVRDGAAIVWFWIGTHAEYDRLTAR